MTKNNKSKKNWHFKKNHVSDRKQKYRKRKGEVVKKKVKTRGAGDWEFSKDQEKFEKNGRRLPEFLIKAEIYPRGSIDPRKIDDFMDEYESALTKILKKKSNNKKLNSTEQTKYDVYINKKNDDEEKDRLEIKKNGLGATVCTSFGIKLKLLCALEHYANNKSNDLVYFVLLKLNQDDLKLNDNDKKEYKTLLNKCNDIVNTLDVIKLQFVKFYDNMPPLNIKGFRSLSDIQIKAVKSMRLFESLILRWPTSAGKSIITGYLAVMLLKGLIKKILIIIPTSSLGWQMSSIFSKIVDDVPLILPKFKSIPWFFEYLEIIKNSNIIVATAADLMDYIAYPDIWNSLKKDLSYIVVDEVHMMGEENKSNTNQMEIPTKIFAAMKIPFILCSATIGNVNELYEWLNVYDGPKINVIESDNRFFNFEKFYFDKDNNLNRIHPFSMISVDSFLDGSILNKNLLATPPDIFKLYEDLKKNKIKLGKLDAYKYFTREQHISLDDANKWFLDLIKFMINNISNKKIVKIINSYKLDNFKEHDVDILKLLFKLKKNKLFPAILFSSNSDTVLNIAKTLFNKLFLIENNMTESKSFKKNLRKIQKNNRRIQKKQDKKESSRGNFKDHSFDKKKLKELKQMKNDESNDIVNISMKEPLRECIFTNELLLTEYEIDKISIELSEFFPRSDDKYHYLLDLLWRGIGVYCIGMPEAYLRIVQRLINNKKIVVVISDEELCYGISMPFKTCVTLFNNMIDNMTCTRYEQGNGRCGRRGEDRKAILIAAGCSKNRLVELSTNGINNIGYCDNRIYTLPHYKELSGDNIWDEMIRNNFSKNISDTMSIDFYSNINKNLLGMEIDGEKYEGPWAFAIDLTKTKNAKLFNHMMIKLRNTKDCYRIAFLIKKGYFTHMCKKFGDYDIRIHENQIKLAHLLLSFINIKEYEDKYYSRKFPKLDILDEEPYNNINERLDLIDLGVTKNKDGNLINCIRENRLVPIINNDGVIDKIKTYEVRHDLLNFMYLLIPIQHYYRLKDDENVITKLFGKLLTRMKYIFDGSSPDNDIDISNNTIVENLAENIYNNLNNTENEIEI